MSNTNAIETKPRLEWIMEYPEPYRTQAIRYIVQFYTAGYMLSEEVPENLALQCFNWKHSHEGEEYWKDFLANRHQKPTKSYRYPWHKAPEWATCAATDENGEAFWYGVQTFTYVHEGELSKIFGQFDATDWRESLEIRPVEFQKQNKPEQ